MHDISAGKLCDSPGRRGQQRKRSCRGNAARVYGCTAGAVSSYPGGKRTAVADDRPGGQGFRVRRSPAHDRDPQESCGRRTKPYGGKIE